MQRRIEGEKLRTDIVILSNQLIDRRGAPVEMQSQVMARMVELLANQPGAVQILGELHTNGAPISGPVAEQPKASPNSKV